MASRTDTDSLRPFWITKWTARMAECECVCITFDDVLCLHDVWEVQTGGRKGAFFKTCESHPWMKIEISSGHLKISYCGQHHSSYLKVIDCDSPIYVFIQAFTWLPNSSHVIPSGIQKWTHNQFKNILH